MTIPVHTKQCTSQSLLVTSRHGVQDLQNEAHGENVAHSLGSVIAENPSRDGHHRRSQSAGGGSPTRNSPSHLQRRVLAKRSSLDRDL